jgi:hypothetical protein
MDSRQEGDSMGKLANNSRDALRKELHTLIGRAIHECVLDINDYVAAYHKDDPKDMPKTLYRAFHKMSKSAIEIQLSILGELKDGSHDWTE